MSHPSGPTTVTVAVPTFRRNEHLVELVPLLIGEADSLEEGYRVRVLIVDNDPDGRAEATVRGFGAGVDYVHEPEPGLTAARNRALSESTGSRLLAFMDDDGRPREGWLRALVEVWRASGAGAVAGRVVERYEGEPQPWMLLGGLYQRRSLPTLTRIDVAPAGNLLLDLDVVRRLGLRFDPRFGFTGGEDNLFTRQLVAAGEALVWCEESVVVDLVPADRMNVRWATRRAWTNGNTATLVDLALAAPGPARWRVRSVSFAGGLARAGFGAVRWTLGVLLRREADRARGRRTTYRGLGMAAGAIGRTQPAYAR